MNSCSSLQEKNQINCVFIFILQILLLVFVPKKWILNLADHLLCDTTKFKDSRGWFHATAEMKIIFKREKTLSWDVLIQKKGIFLK